MNSRRLVCLSLSLGLLVPLHGERDAAWASSLGAGASSQYISEGRNQLEAGGLIWGEATLGGWGLTLGVWQGRGTQVDYDESNLWLSYAYRWERISLGVETRQLWSQLNDAADDDQELSLVASCVLGGPLQADLGATYSFAAQGTFLTCGLSCPLALGPEGSASVTPFILQNFDLGYASEAYDGPNNLEFGISFSQDLGCGFSLEASCHVSCAHHDIHRDGGKNENWVGLALHWTQ